MSLFGSGGRKPEDEPSAAKPAKDDSVRERTESKAPPTDAPGRARTDREGRPRTGAGGTSMASFGKSIVFKGDLSGDEDLEIEGRVEGTVKLPNHQVTIGAHGRVTAQVEAKNVVVIGHVSGNVTAGERVEVQASGVVDGDIQAPRLLIQEGAVVNGSIQMGSAASKSAGPGERPAEKPVPSPTPEAARKTG